MLGSQSISFVRVNLNNYILLLILKFRSHEKGGGRSIFNEVIGGALNFVVAIWGVAQFLDFLISK